MGQTFSTCRLLAAALGVAVSLSAGAVESRTPAIADFQSCAKPVWPKEALRKEQTGIVTLSFLIAADGSVADTKVTRSSGFPLLDEAAVNGLRLCRFKPGAIDGKPVSAWQKMQYVWELEGVPKTPVDQQAVKQLLDAALAGDATAQLDLGYRHEHGKGVARDYAEAMSWYLKSAAQGDHQAEINIGLLHAYGRGVAIDLAEAAKWYRKAADGGNAWGEANLGLFYLYGKGVPEDLPQALHLLELAAARHNAAAERDLATMYLTGRGVAQNNEEGLRYLRLAAADNSVSAQIRLGLVLSHGMFGVAADPAGGVAWQRSASKNGNAVAENNLGYAYETGSGVAQDYAAARDWYVRAAGRGNGNAQAALGGLYERGLGVDQDLGRAAAQYQLAAAQNNADGLYRLAGLHETGLGVQQSATTAAAMYLRSANLDFEAAMRRLAIAYQKGELGLKADAALAREWQAKAEQKAAAPRFDFR